MQKTLLALLAAAVVLGLGLAFWMLRAPAESPAGAGPAQAAARAEERAERAEPSEPVRRSGPEQPAPSAPPAPVEPEPASRAVEASERADASRTRMVEGRVALPAGTPEDELVVILAFVDRDPGAEVLDRPDDAAGELVDQATLGEDGSFRVGFPEGTSVGWLLLDGRYCRAERALEVALPASGEPVAFHPELGGWISGRLVPPEDATEAELEEAGDSIALRPDATRSFGLGSIDPGRRTRRRTRAGEDLTYEFGGVVPGDGMEVRAVPEHLAAVKTSKFSLGPGQHLVLDLPLARGATVSGRVVDAKGGAVAGAEMSARQDPVMFGQGGFTVRTGETEEDGTFVLPAVASGRTLVEARADGFLELTQTVDLAEGEQHTGLEFALEEGKAIAGVVLWPDREPVPDVEVAVSFDPSYLGGMEAMNAMRGARGKDDTDEQGRFRVTGLGNGPFVVQVEAAHEEADGSSTPWKARVSDQKPTGAELELILAAPIGIHGIVVDDLGDPAVAFKVLAREKSGGQGIMTGLGAETHSGEYEDERGRFFLDGLRAGTWELFVSGPDYGRPAPQDVTLPLAEGEIVQVVVERAAVVKGRVVDPVGAPVAGAVVGVKRTLADVGRLTMNEEQPEAGTDEAGAFVLKGLSTGSLDLVARAEGFASSAPVAVELAPAETVEEVVLELRVGGRLLGVVYDSDGDPDAGQMVLAQIPTAPLSQVFGTTDGKGEFLMENLSPGSYQVMTFGGGPDGAKGEESDDVMSFFSDMKIAMAEVVDGEDTYVELGAAPEDPVEVHGTIVAGSEPVEGAVVTFFADGAEGVAMKFATTNSSGRFEMQLEAPGRYAINVQKMLGTGQQQSVEYAEDVPEGPEHEMTLELPLGGIAGKVLGPDGRPQEGVRITLSVDGPIRNGSFTGGNYAEIVTGEDGTYELLWLRPGSYSVAAGGAFLGGFFGDTGAETFGRQVRNGLHVGKGEWLRGIDFELKAPGKIVGEVVDGAGSAVADAAIFLRDRDGNPIDRISVIQTDSKGRFEYLGLEPGDYSVTARGAALVSSEAEAVHVREGQAARARLALSEGTVLVIALSDGEGNPVRCAVEVTGPDGLQVNGLWSLNELMSALGRGSISSEESRVGPLPPGSYRVKATAPDGRTANKPVTLRSGQPERKLNLRLD